MSPVVTEVVYVFELEPLPILRNGVTDPGFERVHHLRVVLEALQQQLGIAENMAPNFEPVDVRVRPTDRRLDTFMELVQSGVLDLDSSPYRRFDALERNL